MIKKFIPARLALVLAGAAALATGALAQTVPDTTVPNTGGLDIPDNLQIFGKVDPNVRKATAIVNGVVITGTDVDQRMALVIYANDYKLNDKDREQLRMFVLRSLIDETLQIQRAKTDEITVSKAELDAAFGKVGANFKQTPETFGAFLRSIGSSEHSVRRQIEGELAWGRFLRRNVEPTTNVPMSEVNAIIARMQADKGTDEYHLFEIYLSATPDREQAVYTSMQQMMQQMRDGKQPFAYFARTYSEATTGPGGGDLGWVRGAMLPTELSTAAAQMQVGQLAGPIPVPGGFSLIYLAEKRQVLMANPLDAKLSLKQIKISFPAGLTDTQANDRATQFAKFAETLTGCGNANALAAAAGAEVVDNDQLTVRNLPEQLRPIILKLQVGQVTPPFGSPAEGVSVLMLCGRDDPKETLPNPQEIQGTMEQQRVNLRAQKILRDLRRDAIIEYR